MVRLESKAASEKRNYTISWATFLGATDTIASSVVTATGVTLLANSNTTTTVSVLVSGGTDGTVARITNTITTVSGLIETEVFILSIETGEPVSLADAKAYCRVLDANDDALITALIKAAREFVENRTEHVLVRRSITAQRPYFGNYIELYRRPVISVDALSYTATDGTAATYSTFTSRLAGSPARVYPAFNGVWPALGVGGEVTVTYTAGYAAGEEPQGLIQAMLMLIATWYDQRETAPTDARNVLEVPYAVDALCGQFKALLV